MRFVRYAESPADFGAGETLRGVAPQLVVGAAGIVVGVLLIVAARPLSRSLWSGSGSLPASPGPRLSHCRRCGADYDPADYEWGGAYPPTCEACGEALDVVGT